MTMIIVTHEMKFAKEVGGPRNCNADSHIIEQGPLKSYSKPLKPAPVPFLRSVLEKE